MPGTGRYGLRRRPAAETLARLPLAYPRGLQSLELAGAHAAALDQRVRACDRLTKHAAGWLKFLAGLGYELSAIEQAVADGVPYTG